MKEESRKRAQVDNVQFVVGKPNKLLKTLNQ
jgi:hypothetical protein